MNATYSQGQLARTNSIIQQAFSWMFGGLLVTGLTSIFAASSVPYQELLHSNPILSFLLIIAEFGLVIAISAGINRMSHATAIGLYLTYAVLTGLTLSSIFWVYTSQSIVAAFISASWAFGIMAVIGYVTKKDLTSIGNLAFMALIGVIIASLVNMFVHLSGLSLILSYLTVLIFTALTAYDTQKLKRMSETIDSDNLGIFGALTLYLDFINIFLALLRIMGGRRN